MYTRLCALVFDEKRQLASESILVEPAEPSGRMVVDFRRSLGTQPSLFDCSDLGNRHLPDGYLAVSTKRDSRTTVTLISPG
jgi:hypothetical protein